MRRMVSRQARPQYWRRPFAGTADQVSAARAFVASLLGDAPVTANAVWVVGELATNAIQHSRSGLPGGTFTVEVTRSCGYVQVAVMDDGGDGEPRLPAADPVDAALAGEEQLPESGLGLYGVHALACRIGTYRYPGGRRVVWSRLREHAAATAGEGR